MEKIRSISCSEPHESWGGWRNFLESCEVRDEVDGVIYYGKTNCNYVLFPDGTLVENYGVSGQNLMNSIRIMGADQVLAAVHESMGDLRELLGRGESGCTKRRNP